MSPQAPLPPKSGAPSADIVILGLGPGNLGDLTLDAWQILAAAPRVLLRTEHHPCVADLPVTGQLESCDDLYEAHESFDQVYAAIAHRVMQQAARPGGVVYAVPGHPWVGETSTRLILEAAAEAGHSTQVVGGASFIEPFVTSQQVDLLDGGQIVDAMLLARQYHPRVEVGLPLLVGQIYARWLASDVKLTLLNAYPPEHTVTLVNRAGTPRERMHRLALHELDRHDSFDHLTSLYVPALAYSHSFSDLQEIVAHLRSPDGCPWDQEQTLDSLRQDLLGEAVEVLEAIDVEQDGSDNSLHIAEELGDVLLLATMMTQIATEEGRFQMGDVTHHIVEKLIRRHPHVFGDTAVEGVEEVFVNWDAIKAEEKAAKGIARHHPLDGVPPHLPALEKARALQSKAKKADLLNQPVLAAQVDDRLAAFRAGPTEATLGDLLWTLVAAAREADLNPENALRSRAVRFRAET